MPLLKMYGLFISHPWDRDVEYERLVTMLHAAPYFRWRNYSVPASRPLPGGPGLGEQLRNQIRPAGIVIILAGMYVNHREWIQHEIDLARSMSKPMIGVYPWRQQRTPALVEQSVVEMVHWNTPALIRAIRQHSL